MNEKIQTVISGLLGLLMVVFGLNKFLLFIAVEPPSDPIAQQFMGAMFTSYLAKIVAIAEIAGGILLFLPKTRFMAWLLLLPVMFNIIAFHLAHDFIGNGIWLLPSLLFIAMGYAHKQRMASLVG